jgi:hypothetical protein
LALCLGLCIAPQLPAQTLSSITGTVTDSSGALTPNAKVTITNVATGVAKTATASSAGTYVVTDLIPGTYTVRVELAGFQAVVLSGVGVEVGRASTVDAVLKAGDVSQTMEVSADVIALDTTQPNLNTTIENRVVQELPNEISGGRGRQIDQFVFLAPGVTGGTFSKRINGGVDFENEVVFNGIPMAQSETQGFQTIWNPPFEQVNQFNVLRSSFSAQYGLAQGVVTYQTASGTNQLHGDAFEILRNDFFDARGAYNATTPVDKEHNYGFSLAGPVILPKLYNGKNRTFFFVTFEWYRLNQSDTSFVSVPTAAEKAGNFGTTGLTIYDPTTGLPFAGNTIPSARFSPLSQSLLQYIPDPTLPGFSNNLQSLRGVLPQRQNPWGFNIDHSINDKQSIHWSEWRDKQTSYGTETGSRLATSNPLTSNTYNPNLGTVFILSYSNTLTPHLVMTAGASWLGELNDQLSQRTTALNFAAAPGAPQVPALHFGGPLSISDLGSNWIASVNRKLGWVIDNNYLWIQGKHTFNIGMEVRRTYQDDNECQQCAGNFNFSNNQTADPNNLGNTGNAFASFLLGTVDSANRTGSTEQRLRNWDFSPYIQDDIKLSRKLTVNLGVRWDVMVPFTAIGNNIVYFDSTIPNPGAGGLLGAATKFGNCTGCANLDRASIHWNHISPRFGVSYALNNKTVLQGGFSQNYLNGGAYEYGTHKVAVNYGNLLLGSFTRNSTGSTAPGFGSWDSNILPYPAPIPFSPTMGIATTINGFNPKDDGRAPYDVVWSLGVQRELPFNMFVTASYAGNRGNFLPSQLNPINQLNPKFLAQYGSLLGQQFNSPSAIAAGIVAPYPNFAHDFGSSATVLQALVPYPQFANIFDNFDDSGSAFYNAMQIQVEKRYTSGLSFLVSYNLSRMMSNTNSGFTSFAATSLNKDNQKAEWSVDNNDQTQVLTIAATYELPFGKGRRFMNRGRIANAAFGGWQLSPLLSYASGSPLQVGVPGNPLGIGGNRPNLVSGQPLQYSYNNVYAGLPVINAAAFSDPGPWAIGNEPRYLSGLRSPAGLNENVALAKYFAVGEKVKFKLEIEYFNVLNRVIFGSPNTSLLDPNFGKVINSQSNTQRQGQAHFTVSF